MSNISMEDLGGTPPGSRPRSRVLENFESIRGARARGWSWEQIGLALGLSGDATRKSFGRVRRAIDAGRIDPQALARAASSTRKTASRPITHQPEQPAQKSDTGWQGWKTLGNQGDKQ